MKAGVAISPDTPSTAISDDVANAADMLLVMTVYPGNSLYFSALLFLILEKKGRGGQKFLQRCVPKVAELRNRFPNKDIEVDGGVGPSTIDVCAQAGKLYFLSHHYTHLFLGSNVIVAGTAIFNAPNPEQVIATLKAAVTAAQLKQAT